MKTPLNTRLLIVAIIYSSLFYDSMAQTSSYQKVLDLNIYDVTTVAPKKSTSGASDSNNLVCFNAQVANEGKFDIVALKIDTTGNIYKHKIFTNNPDFHDWVLESLEENGSYYLTGSSRSLDTSSLHNESAYLLKLDSDLNILSQSNYIVNGQEVFAKSITKSSDGNLIIAGTTVKANNWALFILKVNHDGDIISYREYVAFNGIDVGTVREMANGDIIIAGNIAYDFQYIMPTVIRLSAEGKVIWSKIYIYNVFPFANQNSSLKFVHEFGDNRILVAGHTDYSGAASNGFMDSYVLMLDDNGNTVWTKTFGAADNDWPYNYSINKDNNLVITGGTNSFDSFSSQGFIQIIDTTGNLLNSFVVGETLEFYNLILSGATQYAPNKYVLTGLKRSFNDFNFYFSDLLLDAENGCKVYDFDFNSLDAKSYPVSNYILEVDSSITPVINKKSFHYYTGINESIVCESDPNSVNNPNENDFKLSLFPNPADDQINIDIKECKYHNNLKLMVYNELGINVHSLLINSDTKLELSIAHFPPGLYTVHLKGEGKNIYSKFIKM